MIPLAEKLYIDLAKTSPVVVLVCEVHSRKSLTLHVSVPDSVRDQVLPIVSWYSDADNHEDGDYGDTQEVNLIITFQQTPLDKSKFVITYHQSTTMQ